MHSSCVGFSSSPVSEDSGLVSVCVNHCHNMAFDLIAFLFLSKTHFPVYSDCELTKVKSFPLFSDCSDFSPPVTVILLIFLCLEGFLFLTFTAVMFGTQIHSICNDETVRLGILNQRTCIVLTSSPGINLNYAPLKVSRESSKSPPCRKHCSSPHYRHCQVFGLL